MKWILKTLSIGDKIITRDGVLHDGYTGEKISIPSPYEKPLTITKVFPHGVKTKEIGYVNHNRIISKVE